MPLVNVKYPATLYSNDERKAISDVIRQAVADAMSTHDNPLAADDVKVLIDSYDPVTSHTDRHLWVEVVGLDDAERMLTLKDRLNRVRREIMNNLALEENMTVDSYVTYRVAPDDHWSD